MSKITVGPWHILFYTDVGHGERWFLTSNGVGKEETIEPEIVPPSDRQKWFVVPVPGTENYYKIVQDAASERPPGLAVEGSNKVIHSNLPGEWLVVPIFGNNIYEILTTTEPAKALGAEGHEVVLQRVVPPPARNPAWFTAHFAG